MATELNRKKKNRHRSFHPVSRSTLDWNIETAILRSRELHNQEHTPGIGMHFNQDADRLCKYRKDQHLSRVSLEDSKQSTTKV